MKISVTNARALAEALIQGADQAMSVGHYEFELTDAVQAVDNAARDEMLSALQEAKAKAAS